MFVVVVDFDIEFFTEDIISQATKTDNSSILLIAIANI